MLLIHISPGENDYIYIFNKNKYTAYKNVSKHKPNLLQEFMLHSDLRNKMYSAVYAYPMANAFKEYLTVKTCGDV